MQKAPEYHAFAADFCLNIFVFYTVERAGGAKRGIRVPKSAAPEGRKNPAFLAQGNREAHSITSVPQARFHMAAR